MERTRSHSPEVTVCGLPARTSAQLVADYARVIYDIDYGNGGRQSGVFGPMRNDEIGIGIRPILLPAKRHRECYKDSFTCIGDIISTLPSVSVTIIAKIDSQRAE